MKSSWTIRWSQRSDILRIILVLFVRDLMSAESRKSMGLVGGVTCIALLGLAFLLVPLSTFECGDTGFHISPY